jgi:phosphatidylglycerophosphatase A
MKKTTKAAALTLASWFGCGYFPVAPGTAGSAAAVAIAFALVKYAGFEAWRFLPLAAATWIVGIWAAGVAAESVKAKDPGFVVIDEVAGQWITLAGVQVWTWKSWLAAFVVFRLFDIWKPAPIRRLEALPGGLGITADDAMAGIYGALVLWLAGWFNLY